MSLNVKDEKLDPNPSTYYLNETMPGWIFVHVVFGGTGKTRILMYGSPMQTTRVNRIRP